MNVIKTNELFLKGDFLEKIVSCIPGSAHVKEASSGKYVLCNTTNINIYGLETTQEFIGKTVNDLNSIMKPFWGSAFSNFVEKLDYQTITYREQNVDNNRIFLTVKGLIHIQNMTKLPVLGTSNKVVGIFTSSETITHKLCLVKLYETYKQIYPSKRDAINYFLIHIKLRDYFYINPTDSETKVLIAMRNNDSYKNVAGFLNTEMRTIESHVRNIREKLKDISLATLITLMRNHDHNAK